MPLPIVAATLVEAIAPAKLSTAAMQMAVFTESARGGNTRGNGIGSIVKSIHIIENQCGNNDQHQHDKC